MNASARHHSVESFVDPARRDGILLGAADKQLPATLTRSGAVGWESLRTRFLTCQKNDHRIFVELPEVDLNVVVPAFEQGERVGISFRRGRAKCLFNTTVVGSAPCPTKPDESPNALELDWPDRLQELQRRLFQRIDTPQNRCYECWIAASNSDGPTCAGRLTNLSAGGCGVSVDGAVDFANTDLIELCLSFPPRTGRLTVPARVRHVADDSGGSSQIGLQFLGLDTSLDGQRTLAMLAAVVADLRRSQLPRDRRRLPARR